MPASKPISFQSKDPTPKHTAALAFGCVLILSAILAWITSGRELRSIDFTQIQVYEASDVGLPRALSAADAIRLRSEVRVVKSQRDTQYHLELKAGETPEAIFVSGLGGHSRLYVNAIGIASSEPQIWPNPSHGAQWLSAAIPRTLLYPAGNRIDIVSEASVWRTGLTDVRVGRLAQVEKAGATHTLVQARLQTAASIAGFLGILCLPLLLISARPWSLVLGGALASVWLLLSYYAGSPDGLPLPFMILLSWSDVFLAAVAIIIIVGARSLKGHAGAIAVGVAGAMLLASMCVTLGWRFTFVAPLASTLIQIAPIALTGLALPILVATGIRQLMEERTQSQIEAEKQAALVAAQAAQIQQQAEWQAVLEERKRFTRDIHDGIGGQLVSLLWRVRYESIPSDELASELESGIADLRLVADALDEGPVSLSDALWNFSARARQQLTAAEIEFGWHLPADFDVHWTDARRILSLYRMLQECVTNAVRHAKASRLDVRFAKKKQGHRDIIQIQIDDNGIGFDPQEKPSGRGLTNLTARAAQMSGTIHITPPPHGTGTRIEITIPIETEPFADPASIGAAGLSQT